MNQANKASPEYKSVYEDLYLMLIRQGYNSQVAQSIADYRAHKITRPVSASINAHRAQQMSDL